MPLDRGKLLINFYDKYDNTKANEDHVGTVLSAYKDKSDEQLLTDLYDKYDKEKVNHDHFSKVMDTFGDDSGEPVQKKSPIDNEIQSSQSSIKAAPQPTELSPKLGLDQINEPQENVPQPEQDQGIVNNALGSFNKGITETIPSALEMAGAATHQIQKHILGDESSTFEGQIATKAAGKVREGLEYLFPVDNKFKESYAGQIAQGLGQVAGMAATIPQGAAKAGLHVAKELPGIVKGSAQAAGVALTSKAAAVAAPQVFSSEYKQAKESGADDETAFGVGAVNMIGGTLLETLPVANALKRLDKISGGQVKKALLNTGKTTLEEATTEGLQTAFSNFTAKETYDKSRDILSGVKDAGAVGGGTGFIFSAVLNALGVKLKATKLQSDRTQIENAITDVEQQRDATATEPITNDAVAETENTTVPAQVSPVINEENSSNQQPEVREDSVPTETQEVNEPASIETPQGSEEGNVTDVLPSNEGGEGLGGENVPTEETQPQEQNIDGQVPNTDQQPSGDTGTTEPNTVEPNAEIPVSEGPDKPIDQGVKPEVSPLSKKTITMSKPEFVAKHSKDFTSKEDAEKFFTDSRNKFIYNSNTELSQTQKEYGELYGIPSGNSGRIQVAPIAYVTPKNASDITLDLGQSIGSNIKNIKSGRRALGSYAPGSTAIKIRFKNDLDTTAHELGHSLDDTYKILDNAVNSPEAKKELKDLSKYGSKPQKGYPDPDQYKNGEGMAEFIRAYIVNPGETIKKYPEIYKSFEATVPKETIDKINDFGLDIRTWAGSTNTQKIQSIVNFDPPKQKNTLMEYLKKNSTLNEGFDLSSPWDKLTRNWLNEIHPLEKAVDFLKTKQEKILTPSHDPSILARLFMGVNEKIDNIFQKGMIDSENNRIKSSDGKDMNLKWMLEPFDATDLHTLKTELKESVSYMIAKRVKEQSERFIKENHAAKIAGKVKPHKSTDIINAGAGVYKSMDVVDAALKDFDNLKINNPDKHARYEEAAQRYQDYADGLLRYQVEKGRISEALYQDIKANNQQYVGLGRVMEDVNGFGGKGGGIGSVDKFNKLKGSNRDIISPYEYLMDMTYRSVKEADRNETLRSFTDLLTTNRKMYDKEPINTSSIGQKVSAKEKGSVSVFNNGKEEHWIFEPEIQKVLKNIDDLGYNIPGVFTFLPNLLRSTVTSFPVFALKNRIRDIQQRLITSRNKSKLSDIGFSDKDLDAYQLNGGGQSGLHLLDEGFYYKVMDKTMREMVKSKKHILADPKLIASNIWDNYQNLLSRGERATRIEEYKAAYRKAKKDGLSDYDSNLYAAYESRDLMDFAIGGTVMKVINKVIPFSNAAVQGVKKSVLTAKNDPVGFSVRMALYTMLPQAIFHGLRAALSDDEQKEEYRQMPAYLKDLNYMVPIGEKWLTIPKPYDLGLLSSGIERAFDYADGNKDALEGYAGILSTTLTPLKINDIVGGAGTFIEAMTNYDFFRQKHIIPTDEEGSDIRLRNTKYASKIGQGIQKLSGDNVDARNVDHIIRGLTSYYGNLGLAIADNKIDSKLSGVLKDDQVYSSTDVQWLMNFAKELGQDDGRRKLPQYKAMKSMLFEYYGEENPEAKEKLANEIRKYAKEQRVRFEPKGEEMIQKLIKRKR